MMARFRWGNEEKENRSCEDCDFNVSQSGDLITVNRQNPGPAIQICQNDILVVDVVNKIPGHSLTMHWRGQPNQEAPYMDGVPLPPERTCTTRFPIRTGLGGCSEPSWSDNRTKWTRNANTTTPTPKAT
ncbi:hypothetical protein GEV33_001044 [Tenebrio molitor]|uniref:Plastocyanin-like domain-containing protein n=1 Tax=Tenebrio molitor TaxID=7067 RepID=A0A8J6HWA0_TENMO|nr:hypothetical protein GEV33_001044 [Tenebrio molitor]